MIKLPKEINRALQTFEEAGFPAYAAGEAVCRSLLGREAEDWEIITTAPPERTEALFEEHLRNDENGSIVYAAVGDFEFTVTSAPDLEKELMERSFTISAMADNPARAFLDPSEGKKDLREKLVRTIDEPEAFFQKNPEMIFRAIALAAELDLDIQMNTFSAMKNQSAELSRLTADQLRDGFGEVLTAKSPARGLRFSVAAGIMPYVLGEECYPPKSRHEIDQFNTLMENYDRVRPELEYRYPMLFLCFDEKKAMTAIERLHFDEESRFKYTSALHKTQELYFVIKPYDFKKFLYQNGWDNYEYWENIVKQQRKVYDHPENRIMSRFYMKQEFDQYKMAVFLEDLAVDKDDLIADGIPEKKAGIILEKLLYTVHYKPRLNTREHLLAEARRYNKNPFVKFFRDVHFFR